MKGIVNSVLRSGVLGGLLFGVGLVEFIHSGHAQPGMLPRTAALAVMLAGAALLAAESRKRKKENE